MRIRSEILNSWIDENMPHGFEKLVVNCGLSRGLLEKARAGHVPKRDRSIQRLCTALGVTRDQLINQDEDPPGSADKDHAS